MSWVLEELPDDERSMAEQALMSYQNFIASGDIDDSARVELGQAVYQTVLEQDVLFFGTVYLSVHFSHEEAEFHKPLAKLLHKRTYLSAAAPRGHAKSTITTVAHSIHEAAMGRAKFILIIGNTQQTAADHLDAILGELIENQKLTRDFPHLSPPDAAELRRERKKKKKQRQTDFVTRGNIRFVARGAGQPLRGAKERNFRPDLIILDDVDDDKTVRSETMRENLFKWFDKVVMNLEGVVQARIRVIGTILHKHALLNKLIQRWDGDVWKAITNWDKQTVQWPSVWSYNRLMTKRDGGYDGETKIKGVGHIVFAQEYMNDPQEDIAHPMRESWIQLAPAIPEGLRKAGLVFIGVDLALSEKEKSSYNALVVHIVDKRTDETYVVDAMRWRAPINETKRIIAAASNFWKPDLVGIEAVQFQAAVVQQMIEEMPLFLYAGIMPDRDKASRFQVLANQYSLRKFKHLPLGDLGDGVVPDSTTYYPWTGKLPRIYQQELLEFPEVDQTDFCDASVYAYLARFMPYGVQTISTAALIQDTQGENW